MRLFAMAMVLTAGTATAAPVPKGAGEGDPLPKDSVWTGKLTQRGGGPDGFDCEFKITKRDGDKFEADLYEKAGAMELTYLVKGTVVPVDPKGSEKGFNIEFTSHEAKDVKNTSEILNVPYTGKVEGKKIRARGSCRTIANSATLKGISSSSRRRKSSRHYPSDTNHFHS